MDGQAPQRGWVPARRIAAGGLCAVLVGAVVACSSSAEAPPPKSPGKVAAVPTCREAVFDESRLLVTALGETDAPQGLAIQLDELAASLEITWETLESLGQLRTRARELVDPKHGPDVDRAAKLVQRACAGLDIPEERAKTALDGAIKSLADENYEKFLETYIPPADLAQMKRNGGFRPAIARFRDGFGEELHGQLVRARKSEPVLKPDGSVEFRAKGADGESDEVIVLEAIGGRWFFRQ